MRKVRYHNRFKKDYKRMQKRGYDVTRLQEAIQILAEGKPLPPNYRDHVLTGNYRNYRECHIMPDWLLVYQIQEEELILLLFRTGSHSDLF